MRLKALEKQKSYLEDRWKKSERRRKYKKWKKAGERAKRWAQEDENEFSEDNDDSDFVSDQDKGDDNEF